MQKIFYLLCLSILLTACDDGDIIEVELDFDKQLSVCELDPNTYYLYDTKTDPSESLSLIFPSNTTTKLIFNPAVNNYTSTFELNGTTTKFNYRTYDGDPKNLICNLLTDATTNIINDYAATSGTVTTVTTFVDDDGDGIPSELEIGDSDGDGIPDYLDADDDNDNVLTKNEGHNYTVAALLSNAQDTDGDGVPDYLDNDDDGDGVLTRLEDENLNGNPLDDRDESTPTPSIARYLDKVATDVFNYPSFNKNTYQRTISVKFQISNVNLNVISLTAIDFGTYTQTFTIESE